VAPGHRSQGAGTSGKRGSTNRVPRVAMGPHPTPFPGATGDQHRVGTDTGSYLLPRNSLFSVVNRADPSLEIQRTRFQSKILERRTTCPSKSIFPFWSAAALPPFNTPLDLTGHFEARPCPATTSFSNCQSCSSFYGFRYSLTKATFL
jgi:hypothetical protein